MKKDHQLNDQVEKLNDQVATTQLAKKWVQILDTQQTLPPEVTVALEQARQKAMALHARQSGDGVLRQGNTFVLLPMMQQHKLVWWAIAALSALLLALWLGQVIPSDGLPADEDTLLLASELPPEAFIDNGFHRWISTGASGS